MKLKLLFVTIFFTNFLATTVTAQQIDFITEYLDRFENSREYLLKVARLMPEDKYDYKASNESLTFAENLMHIGYAMDWHTQSLLGERASRDWNTDKRYKVANKSKEEIIRTINKTFQESIAFIKQFNTDTFKVELDYFGLTRTKRQIFLLLADHITHHRGQLLVYLRLNDITPPRYVLYQ
ncbi:DinB family protein [Muricauda sp. 2012CJ35-5]|uniref:DinB family protein n=1 Tax=Flagellimonas spongiicola TaxID=2942208 RepID=A0ABT0PQQ8_9FLAO|nr:DinB family protein [Allomuricauda spongiicola]MCL6273723.1 DinB family protein [Allomuricauda spongiicola]